jgi:hypothetical protein
MAQQTIEQALALCWGGTYKWLLMLFQKTGVEISIVLHSTEITYGFVVVNIGSDWVRGKGLVVEFALADSHLEWISKILTTESSSIKLSTKGLVLVNIIF